MCQETVKCGQGLVCATDRIWWPLSQGAGAPLDHCGQFLRPQNFLPLLLVTTSSAEISSTGILQAENGRTGDSVRQDRTSYGREDRIRVKHYWTRQKMKRRSRKGGRQEQQRTGMTKAIDRNQDKRIGCTSQLHIHNETLHRLLCPVRS